MIQNQICGLEFIGYMSACGAKDAAELLLEGKCHMGESYIIFADMDPTVFRGYEEVLAELLLEGKCHMGESCLFLKTWIPTVFKGYEQLFCEFL